MCVCAYKNIYIYIMSYIKAENFNTVKSYKKEYRENLEMSNSNYCL